MGTVRLMINFVPSCSDLIYCFQPAKVFVNAEFEAEKKKKKKNAGVSMMAC